MIKNFKQYLKILSNPFLFYVDNQGNSVFRNFCLFKNGGNSYKRTIPIKDAGRILEYRIALGKYLNRYTVFLTIALYLLFIHTNFTFQGFILYEILWIILYFAARFVCMSFYEKKLKNAYGEYNVVDFNPQISEEKIRQYFTDYINKCLAIMIIICLYAVIGLALLGAIKISVNLKKPNYNTAEILTDFYTKFYPQKAFLYEIKACADYISGDFNRASANYIKAFKLRGSKFDNKDYTRFANLLFLIKKSSGSQNAIDIYNEFYTKKQLSVPQKTKLLWVKSMFSVNSNLTDFIVNDYQDLLSSLKKNDKKNSFYILSDEAYMLYLIKDYKDALSIYNSLINFAIQNPKNFDTELTRLYAERSFVKRRLKDNIGANEDYLNSKLDMYELKKYEPKAIDSGFIIQKF